RAPEGARDNGEGERGEGYGERGAIGCAGHGAGSVIKVFLLVREPLPRARPGVHVHRRGCWRSGLMLLGPGSSPGQRRRVGLAVSSHFCPCRPGQAQRTPHPPLRGTFSPREGRRERVSAGQESPYTPSSTSPAAS